jgi:hypothetical protein
MLIRFHSKAAAAVTMFGDIAVELLRLMGMSGAVPGAVLAKDVPEALRRLKVAVQSPAGERVPALPHAGVRKPKDETEQEQEQEGAKINLRTRAYSLVQLLEAAASERCDVVWEESDKATG